MKRLLLIIGIMAAFTANAQNYSRHTFHWDDGTSTSVTTIGSHTYVHDYSTPETVVYDALDSLGNRYSVGMRTDTYYKVNGLPIPTEGSGYTVYTREYDMESRRTVWTEVGRLTVEDVRARKMTFDITGEIENMDHNTFIVYDEYLDYFIDKNVNNLSTRRLERKYGYGFVIDCDIAVILKK